MNFWNILLDILVILLIFKLIPILLPFVIIALISFFIFKMYRERKIKKYIDEHEEYIYNQDTQNSNIIDVEYREVEEETYDQ